MGLGFGVQAGINKSVQKGIIMCGDLAKSRKLEAPD